jgi:hypothetical protein
VITSPDQHKPGHRKGAIAGAAFTVIALLFMLATPSTGAYGYIFLLITAALIVLVFLADWGLRRNGLRRRD